MSKVQLIQNKQTAMKTWAHETHIYWNADCCTCATEFMSLWRQFVLLQFIEWKSGGIVKILLQGEMAWRYNRKISRVTLQVIVYFIRYPFKTESTTFRPHCGCSTHVAGYTTVNAITDVLTRLHLHVKSLHRMQTRAPLRVRLQKPGVRVCWQ